MKETFEIEAVDFDTARDMLSLVDKKLFKKDWNAWTLHQRMLAMVWAAKTHLRASDNIVRVPDEPAWVRRLKADN